MPIKDIFMSSSLWKLQSLDMKLDLRWKGCKGKTKTFDRKIYLIKWMAGHPWVGFSLWIMWPINLHKKMLLLTNENTRHFQCKWWRRTWERMQVRKEDEQEIKTLFPTSLTSCFDKNIHSYSKRDVPGLPISLLQCLPSHLLCWRRGPSMSQQPASIPSAPCQFRGHKTHTGYCWN